MGPRLSGLTSIFGVAFFVSKSLLGIERQKKLEKFAILTRKPRSHAWILIYRTWPIALSIRRTLSIWGPGIRSFNISPSLFPIFLYQLCSGRNNFEEFKTAEIRLQQCADFLLKSFAFLSVSRNCIFIRMEDFFPNFGAVKSSLFHHFKLGSW